MGISTYFWSLELLVLLILAGLFFLAWRDEQRRQAFGFLKPATKLRPEDLNFQSLKQAPRPGEYLAQNLRPFYEFAYVSRKAVPYDHAADENPQPQTTREPWYGLCEMARVSSCRALL